MQEFLGFTKVFLGTMGNWTWHLLAKNVGMNVNSLEGTVVLYRNARHAHHAHSVNTEQKC